MRLANDNTGLRRYAPGFWRATPPKRCLSRGCEVRENIGETPVLAVFRGLGVCYNSRIVGLETPGADERPHGDTSSGDLTDGFGGLWWAALVVAGLLLMGFGIASLF